MADTVIVRARRPYVHGAIAYGPGDVFAVPVLEALRLATKGIVSLSKGARRPVPPVERPKRAARKKSAA